MNKYWIEAVLHLFGKFKVVNININTIAPLGSKFSVICGRNGKNLLLFTSITPISLVPRTRAHKGNSDPFSYFPLLWYGPTLTSFYNGH